VRNAFIAYHRGEWSMPPKVYVPAYPAGDFRAMPALGGGYAALKWVTSFPGNPARGLPTVTGLVLSSAEDGRLVACFDAASSAGAWVRYSLAAQTLGRGMRRRRGHRRRRQRTGSSPDVRAAASADVDRTRAESAAAELDADVAGSLDEALAADLVVTMTPGHKPVVEEGRLQPGQHVSLMGADGPGKAEIVVAELARTHVFCDDWGKEPQRLSAHC
jgi:ornithine cyclodeaminase/alanine dehydrogenase-like protein (mu-crystallin family)